MTTPETTKPQTTQPPRIAIIGAGPAGLTCARVLQRHGLAPTVYDADRAVDARDAGGTLDLHADSGQIALEDAGLLDAFLAVASVTRQAKIRMDEHGTVLHSFVPDASDAAAPEIDRGRLRALLSAHVAPGTVRWGHRLTGLAPGGDGTWRLEFAGAPGARADVVIGADGAWSKVRPLLTDAAPEHLGVCFLDARYDDVDRRHPGIAALVGDGHLFVNDGAGRGIILQRNADGVVRGYLAFRAPRDWAAQAGVDTGDRAAVSAYLLEEFAHWAPQLRQAITGTDGSFVPRSFAALPAPLTWDRRPGVTLIGDAAHLMGPFGGHGANLAMVDGAELARALATADTTEEALGRYEREMFARSGPLAQASNDATRRFFADRAPGAAPHLPPDPAASHRAYEERAAAHRQRRAEQAQA
jgi:2-polyprenyl-6-methoxyphenol hydroxylase-like FAD-dependent oxidoreductase